MKGWVWWGTSVIPALSGQRGENYCKIKAKLAYTARPYLGWEREGKQNEQWVFAYQVAMLIAAQKAQLSALGGPRRGQIPFCKESGAGTG